MSMPVGGFQIPGSGVPQAQPQGPPPGPPPHIIMPNPALRTLLDKLNALGTPGGLESKVGTSSFLTQKDNQLHQQLFTLAPNDPSRQGIQDRISSTENSLGMFQMRDFADSQLPPSDPVAIQMKGRVMILGSLDPSSKAYQAVQDDTLLLGFENPQFLPAANKLLIAAMQHSVQAIANTLDTVSSTLSPSDPTALGLTARRGIVANIISGLTNLLSTPGATIDDAKQLIASANSAPKPTGASSLLGMPNL